MIDLRLRGPLLALLIVAPRPALAAVCQPVELWRWDGPVRDPVLTHPTSTPLVVQVNDDSGDGRIDGGDRPDVVFIHSDGFAGVVTAVDGTTGQEHWTQNSWLVLATPIAAGDIDGDGVVEIVAVADDHLHLLAFEADGSLKWTSDPSPRSIYQYAALNIADLDQDGSPELYTGATVFSATGSLLWDGQAGRGVDPYSQAIAISNALEIDPGSPGLELLAGNTLYDVHGGVLWQAAAPDGWTAVADFDRDGDPEIVLASGSEVRLLDHLGNVLGPAHSFPGWATMSQPVAGDIDGDGLPEVIVIQETEMRALAWTGTGFTVLWSAATSDGSRAATASLFDLDGDGAAEVLYNGDLFFYILDGRSGAFLTRMPQGSGTVIEAPVVADLDGDCDSEILIIAPAGGSQTHTAAVLALKCAPSVAARPIWNQYSYHVTNVDDDGGIPVVEAPPWSVGLGWMQQVPGGGGAVAEAGPPTAVCEGQSATLDGSGSAGCPAPVYHWLDGLADACLASSSPTCTVTPPATTVYTLEISCACGPIATDTVQVTVVPDPDPVPIGNSLRAVEASADVALTWATSPNAASYTLDRGTRKGRWPASPFRPLLPAPALTLADVPPPTPLYFYRSWAASCSGKQGP